MSIRGPINYDSFLGGSFLPSKVENYGNICPHCGRDTRSKPNEVFDFTQREIIIRSRRFSGVTWRRHVAPKTWEVLMFLLKHNGAYITNERILMACFGEDVDGGAVVVHITNLRKLLEGTIYYIETKYALGYRLLQG